MAICELSKHLKIVRQTVLKMLQDAEMPKYNRKQRRTCLVMDPYRAFIDYSMTRPHRLSSGIHQQEHSNGWSMITDSVKENLEKSGSSQDCVVKDTINRLIKRFEMMPLRE